MADRADTRLNRAYWEARSDEYQRLHGPQLNRDDCAWGVWSIPEDDLQVLGDVRGKRVLELGCGAGQWSIHLKMRGALPTGLDFSLRQLAHARELMLSHGVTVPLICAGAESIPLADESFDLVFCDHGAVSFADPRHVVPEVARVLRQGGVFAFNRSSPFFWCFYDAERDEIVERLASSYFGNPRLESAGSVEYHLTYGEWIRLFRDNGLAVEDLVELRPPLDAATTYEDYVPLDWARNWPAETIWKVRKL